MKRQLFTVAALNKRMPRSDSFPKGQILARTRMMSVPNSSPSGGISELTLVQSDKKRSREFEMFAADEDLNVYPGEFTADSEATCQTTIAMDDEPNAGSRLLAALAFIDGEPVNLVKIDCVRVTNFTKEKRTVFMRIAAALPSHVTNECKREYFAEAAANASPDAGVWVATPDYAWHFKSRQVRAPNIVGGKMPTAENIDQLNRYIAAVSGKDEHGLFHCVSMRLDVFSKCENAFRGKAANASVSERDLCYRLDKEVATGVRQNATALLQFNVNTPGELNVAELVKFLSRPVNGRELDCSVEPLIESFVPIRQIDPIYWTSTGDPTISLSFVLKSCRMRGVELRGLEFCFDGPNSHRYNGYLAEPNNAMPAAIDAVMADLIECPYGYFKTLGIRKESPMVCREPSIAPAFYYNALSK